MAHYIAIASDQSQEITGLITFSGNLGIHINTLSLEVAEVLFELFPYGTEDILYRQFINQLLPRFAGLLEPEDYHAHSLEYTERRCLYRSLAYHALHLKEENLRAFLAPFIEHLNCDRNCADFIRELIRAEIALRSGAQFWAIWRYFYNKVLARCVDHHGEVLQVYLLADRLSTPEMLEWHSFDDNNSLWLYDNASRDCGDSATTMYSIARNLNYFARKFESKGIEWLYAMVSKYPSIDLRGKESDTIFYMERFIGEVIRKNRSEIRKDKSKKSKLMTILTFMVEKNSVQAFMLRDIIA